MKRQAWQDLRLRFVISHSLVAGQLYSIFPAIKHRDGHPGTTFSPLIQGQALVPRYSTHLHTYILWDHNWLMMALREPELLIRTHFRRKKKKKQHCSKYWEKPVQPRGWTQCWAFRYYVPSRDVIILCAASLITWPVPRSPGLRMGAVSDISSIPLAASLASRLWDGCHLSFLALLGGPGSSLMVFPPFLPPASWDTGLRKTDKMSCKMNTGSLCKYFQFYFISPCAPASHPSAQSTSISFPIPFHLWWPHNTTSETKEGKKYPKFISGHTVFYHKPRM